ncbi:MAG: acyl-CoA dehydrogenase family protein [Vicinamibacterales bacterium]|jgi:butyryl-CoA dehydrogenase|nr:acyl-CoA dehydrogenase family protein [Vicinamibacterales bacterium]
MMRLEPTAEQREFHESADRFAREVVEPLAAQIDETGAFPTDTVRRMGALGLLGTTIAPDWGGAGRDYVSYALAIEALARASATVAVIASVNNSLVAEPLAEFGTDAQKQAWLRRLATGEALGCFALSEEQAGTDAANQQTRASFDGHGYRLNGRKAWVANAEVADLAIVFAATQPDIAGRGITAFLVPMDSPGIERRARYDSLGVRGLGCTDLEFADVHVDSSQVLGALGKGFTIARWALDGGRVAIAAQALGVGRAALEEAIAYAKHRTTFGQAIANYQAVQWMLADAATELDAARMLMWKAACARDTQERCTLEASMAKLAASEAAHRAADKAMQILASAGYRRGSKVERLFRDVRATEIYQGTSEVQRMIIAASVLA